MKKNKKTQNIISFSMTIMLITLMLVSCQSTPSSAGESGGSTQAEQGSDSGEVEVSTTDEDASAQGDSESSTKSSTISVDVDSLDGTEVRFWHPWVDEADEKIQDLVTEFNQTNEWGVIVTVTTPGSSGELYEQIRVANEKEGEQFMMEEAGVSLSSGKSYIHASGTLDYGAPPDVFIAPMDHMLSLEEYGIAIADLSDYVSLPDLGFSDQDLADYPAVFWKYAQIDNKLYGIPAERAYYMLFYNKTWAEELGFSKPPSTIEEFKEQACTAAENNNKLAQREGNTNPEEFIWDDQLRKVGTGGWIIKVNTPEILSWIMAYSEGGVEPAEDGTYSFNNDETINAFMFIHQLYDEGCAWVSRNPEPYEYFVNRQALFYSGINPDILIQKRIQELTISGEDNDSETEGEISLDEWVAIPYPTEDGNPRILLNSLSYGILESNPNTQLAGWLFIRWMSQSQNVASFVESNGTIPVRVSANDLLNNFSKSYPQWQGTLNWVPMTYPAPATSSWRIAGNILQDGAWHIFEVGSSSDQISDVLGQMDEMILEVNEEME